MKRPAVLLWAHYTNSIKYLKGVTRDSGRIGHFLPRPSVTFTAFYTTGASKGGGGECCTYQLGTFVYVFKNLRAFKCQHIFSYSLASLYIHLYYFIFQSSSYLLFYCCLKYVELFIVVRVFTSAFSCDSRQISFCKDHQS